MRRIPTRRMRPRTLACSASSLADRPHPGHPAAGAACGSGNSLFRPARNVPHAARAASRGTNRAVTDPNVPRVEFLTARGTLGSSALPAGRALLGEGADALAEVL